MRSEHQRVGPGLKIGATAGALTILGSVVLQSLPTIVPIHFPLGVSLQFGISLTIIGLQWDIFYIVKKTTETRNRANILMEALETSDLHEEELVHLCEYSASISGRQDLPEWVVEDIENIIAVLSKSFGELLHNERFKLDSEGRLLYYLIELTKNCTDSIYATSALEGVDAKFWDSEGGQTYLSIQGQRKFKHPQMTLQRIFLVSRHDLDDQVKKDALYQIILRHEKAGFQVGVLKECPMQDVVIFDEQATIFSNRGAHGEVATGGVADFDKARIRAQTAEFNNWWGTAENNRIAYWPESDTSAPR